MYYKSFLVRVWRQELPESAVSPPSEDEWVIQTETFPEGEIQYFPSLDHLCAFLRRSVGVPQSQSETESEQVFQEAAAQNSIT